MIDKNLTWYKGIGFKITASDWGDSPNDFLDAQVIIWQNGRLVGNCHPYFEQIRSPYDAFSLGDTHRIYPLRGDQLRLGGPLSYTDADADEALADLREASGCILVRKKALLQVIANEGVTEEDEAEEALRYAKAYIEGLIYDVTFVDAELRPIDRFEHIYWYESADSFAREQIDSWVMSGAGCEVEVVALWGDGRYTFTEEIQPYAVQTHEFERGVALRYGSEVKMVISRPRQSRD